MNARFLLAAALLAGGCGAFASYDNRTLMTDAHQKAYARVEAYYLGKAHDQAAFSLDCAPDQVKTKVVSTSAGRVGFYDQGTWIAIEHADQIASIGAEGCGRRSSYLVLCGPLQDYGNIEGRNSMKPCDIIPSSDAVRTANTNALGQQQLLNDEAARQQQQQQQSSNH